MNLDFDWRSITSTAYLALVQLNITSFPIPHKEIKCEGVMVISYQKYSRVTGLSLDQITCGHQLDDAFVLRNLRPGTSFILYNKDKITSRVKHTLWHEVGHIKCKHIKHGDKEEIEANFFASQANAPNAIIKEISKRGYKIDVQFLIDCFGLSKESANKKMDYLGRYHFDHTNEYDDVILQLFSIFINSKYPPRNAHYYDDYFEELENKRLNW